MPFPIFKEIIIEILFALTLVKEIVSKSGELHFRRFRLLELPWFRIYIHQILKADKDLYEHDHPWSFIISIPAGSTTRPIGQ